MIKIILAEGHNVVRNGIRLLLDKEIDIEVIAEANNAKEVLEILNDGLKPDIILTAINLPNVSGIDLVTKVRLTHPDIKVVMLSMIEEEKYVIQAFKAGAIGYMLKSVNEFELVYGIRHVYLVNERYLCNELALRLLDKLLRIPENKFDVHVNDIEISKREVEILSLVSEGFTNQEIADKLFTSKRTIEGHRQGLIEKTGTRNTAALIRYAVLNSIIE
ncbi:response regulator transcription factor [Mucilaginibacter sp.]|jgi:DNA-binding NarL/FixJ family response regulator|uniref:response regulator transcription factor n=1 Tax=Mucilaginibacter sp. TaxID=1882438 RepID=UPI00263360A6|nr:response regulator transcription factor [Mucilaginibacter sp.]MDB5125975.1 Response regulator receiver protein [Mucilaginibacter sp.]